MAVVRPYSWMALFADVYSEWFSCFPQFAEADQRILGLVSDGAVEQTLSLTLTVRVLFGEFMRLRCKGFRIPILVGSNCYSRTYLAEQQN
jgi:hypothetical protein